MKKIIAYPIVHLFCFIGHKISQIMMNLDWYWLYKFYNWFMIKSLHIQEWAKLEKPWKEPDVTNNN